MSERSKPIYSIEKLIAQTRNLAVEYRRTTGKALPGMSGEIARYDAARILNLEIPKETPGGYDAIGLGLREGRKVQIKGRMLADCQKGGQRIGQIKMDQEWDSLLLVIMDDNYEPIDIYEAMRDEIIAATEESKDSKRNKRGAMSVAKFRAISQLVWTADAE